MSTPDLELHRKLLEIPSFPPIAARILRALSNENADIGDVLELVKAEPAVSARILLQANSPIYGFPSRIENLRQALVLLGPRRIKAVTVRVATSNYVRAAMRVEELRRCWRHTLATAVLSELLARACDADPEEAYTAGLLHDIGRLGLVVAFPGEYVEALREAASKSLDILDYERRLFGKHHAEVGAWLVEQWNFPPELQVIAGRHHDRPDGAETNLLTLIHYACRLADVLGFDVVKPLQQVSVAEIVAELPAEAQRFISHDAEELRQLVQQSLEPLDSAEVEALEVVPQAEELVEPVTLETRQPAPRPEPPPSAPPPRWLLAAAGGLLLAGLLAALLLRTV